MGDIDLGDFVSGGYILTRPAIRNDEYQSAELLPSQIYTASSCLTDVAFEYWWTEENVAQAIDFGVPQYRWPELMAWYRAEFGTRIGAPGICRSPGVITEFAERFTTDTAGLVLLGLGLGPDHATELVANHRTPDDLGEYGVFEELERRSKLERGGDVLGFEVLSYEYGIEHSWLCNGLEQIAHDRLGITPNSAGLIESADQATAVASMANTSTAVEPGLWLPWLLVRYPLDR